jgi:hypothetical protein
MKPLPNYFFADLPPEAALSPDLIQDACLTLRRNREQYLTERSTDSLIEVLSGLGRNWLQPEDPFRQMALVEGPAATGFSEPVLAKGLDSFFSQLTRENLKTLILQDLGGARRLDQLSANHEERAASRAAGVQGPELLVHFTAGTLPNPTLHSMVLGLLVRSAQFIKCASGGTFIPRLFAHSLYETEPKLAACLEITGWPGGSTDLEAILLNDANCVTATGRDETLNAIRQRLPLNTRFLGYGHRVSFGYIAREMLSGFSVDKVVSRTADDVVAWDQLGCLSPHVLYVEKGGAVSPENLAERLATELEAREQHEPRGRLSDEEAGEIATRRAFYEVRAAHSPQTRHWQSKHSTAWTVIYELDPQFQYSCLNRFIYLKEVTDLTEALQGADPVRRLVSTVGLAAPENRVESLANDLARWGAARVCPIGRMQQPPLTWRHDGRPSLGDLVTWTDWEF